MRQRRIEQFIKRPIFSCAARRHGTVCGASQFYLPAYHFRMLEIVFIYRNAVVRLASEYPFRFDVHKALPLLEDKDIRNCIRSSRALKYGVGQPHRAEQFRPLCDISPY